MVDMEDLGKLLKKGKSSAIVSSEPKEMVTPSLRKSLTKQGYKIIGSHSGAGLYIFPENHIPPPPPLSKMIFFSPNTDWG